MKILFPALVILYLIASTGYDVYVGEVSLKGAETYTAGENPIIFWAFIIFRAALVVGLILYAKHSLKAEK